MTLGIVELPDGQRAVTGITSSQTAPFPLGRHYFRPGGGPHHVGFDDSFGEPVIVKAFYDPDADAAKLNKLKPYTYIGYMQIMQFSFAGNAIPPEVYSSRMADRVPYVARGHNSQFIDFMGPADARLRTIINPFYAFNGALLKQIGPNPQDFAAHPLPNGSLYYPPPASGPNKSSCASLSAEVSTNLITDADLRDSLSEEPIFEVTCSTQQWADKEAYQIVLEYLRAAPERRSTLAAARGDTIKEYPAVQDNDLAGVENSDLAGEVIGEYTLITLPSDENLAPHLCVESSNSDRQIKVYLLDYYTMVSLRESAVMRMLSNINDYIQKRQTNVRPDSPPVQPAGTRGLRGLTPIPSDQPPGKFFIELKYQTGAVAYRPRNTRGAPGLEWISGFVWAARFMFDADSRTLKLSSIVEPAPLLVCNVQPFCTQYQAAYNDVRLSKAKIDTSNFTKAAMRRDAFGAAVKLTFVNKSGRVLSS